MCRCRRCQRHATSATHEERSNSINKTCASLRQQTLTLMRFWQHRLRMAKCRRLLLFASSVYRKLEKACATSEDSWDKFADPRAVLRVLLTMQALHFCLLHICLQVCNSLCVSRTLLSACSNNSSSSLTAAGLSSNLSTKHHTTLLQCGLCNDWYGADKAASNAWCSCTVC